MLQVIRWSWIWTSQRIVALQAFSYGVINNNFRSSIFWFIIFLHKLENHPELFFLTCLFLKRARYKNIDFTLWKCFFLAWRCTVISNLVFAERNRTFARLPFDAPSIGQVCKNTTIGVEIVISERLAWIHQILIEFMSWYSEIHIRSVSKFYAKLLRISDIKWITVHSYFCFSTIQKILYSAACRLKNDTRKIYCVLWKCFMSWFHGVFFL